MKRLVHFLVWLLLAPGDWVADRLDVMFLG